jgi:hypothetical protein
MWSLLHVGGTQVKSGSVDLRDMVQLAAGDVGRWLCGVCCISALMHAASAGNRFCDDESPAARESIQALRGQPFDSDVKRRILSFTRASQIQKISPTEAALGNFVEGRVTVYTDETGRIVSIECK